MKDKRKKNITRVVLSALILALSPVMHLFATEPTMSYEEYFSQERELTKTPVTSVNSNWIGEPFIVTEATIDWWQEQYPQQAEQMFAERYASFTEMDQMPAHTHSAIWVKTTTQHWKECSSCGNSLTAKSWHSFVNDVCSVCNYLRRPQIRLTDIPLIEISPKLHMVN